MSSVAGAISHVMARMDKLQSEVAKLAKNAAENASTAVSSSPKADVPEQREVDTAVVRLQRDLDEFKEGHAANAKKDRSITEAVVAQKVERVLVERISSANTAVSDLRERLQETNKAVDNQASFIKDLAVKIDQRIEACVVKVVTAVLNSSVRPLIDGAVKDALKMQEEHADAAPPAHNSGTTEEKLSALEESPDLSSHTDGDQIDMTPKNTSARSRGSKK